jgi:hypothetical protein
MGDRMSNLTVNQLTALDPVTHLINVATGDTVYSPGSVVQVVNTTIYTPTAVSIPAGAAANTNIPDFFATITPKKNTSRIYVQVRWFGELSPQTANWDTMFGLKRNGTAVGVNPNTAGGSTGISMAAITYYANDASSTPEICSFDFWDSPGTTSGLTYQAYANCVNAAITLFTNRTVTPGGSGLEYGSSTITLWEIAQ